jgi:alpha-L-fucosidase
LYNNHKWHNPVVVKLENVKPAFREPPYAATGTATVSDGGRAALQGNLVTLGDANAVEVGVEFQEYLGFAEAMYNTQWTPSAGQTMEAPGSFEIAIDGLEPNVEYQYRVFVKHPKITVRGDYKRFKAK